MNSHPFSTTPAFEDDDGNRYYVRDARKVPDDESVWIVNVFQDQFTPLDRSIFFLALDADAHDPGASIDAPALLARCQAEMSEGWAGPAVTLSAVEESIDRLTAESALPIVIHKTRPS